VTWNCPTCGTVCKNEPPSDIAVDQILLTEVKQQLDAERQKCETLREALEKVTSMVSPNPRNGSFPRIGTS